MGPLFSSQAALASAIGLLNRSPRHLCIMAIFFHLGEKKKKSLQKLVLEVKSVLGRSMKTLLLQELS